jgi:hypothetical protein
MRDLLLYAWHFWAFPFACGAVIAVATAFIEYHHKKEKRNDD